MLTSEGNIHVRKFAKFRQGSTLSKKSVVKVPRLQGDKNFDSMTSEQLKGMMTHRKVTSLAGPEVWWKWRKDGTRKMARF